MGNTPFRDLERTCGKFPAPARVRPKKHRNLVGSVGSVDVEQLQQILNGNNNNNDNNNPAEQTDAPDTNKTTTNNNNNSKTNKVGGGGSGSGWKSLIRTTLKDIFDPPEPERLPPKRYPPKQLLWGCTTMDEHYDYRDAMIDRVANLKGKEGLDAMGFEFRWVHHHKTCTCVMNIDDDDLTDSEAGDDDLDIDDDDHDLVVVNDDDGYWEDSEDDDDDYNDTQREGSPSTTNNSNNKAATTTTTSTTTTNGTIDEYGQFESDDNSDIFSSPTASCTKNNAESFMVPTGSSLKEYAAASGGDFTASIQSSSTTGGGGMSRNSSVASLFSLATHNTEFSYGTNNNNGNRRSSSSSSSRRNNNLPPKSTSTTTTTTTARFPLAAIASATNTKNWVMEQDSCALRLHHRPSRNTMITAENHSQFMADGKMYDELSRLCMEYAQEVMLEEGDMEWFTICPERQFGAMVSRSFFDKRQQRRRQPPSDDNHNNDDDDGDETNQNNQHQKNHNHKTLVVVTGKGEVRAGIFSRRHLLVTSMEAATALPFIRGAKERNMDIVILDPNALGYRLGMDVVETSLERLFLDRRHRHRHDEDEDEIYILAHSMAGAQIVRFFTGSSSSYGSSRSPPTPASSRPPTPAPSGASSSSSSDTSPPNGNSNSLHNDNNNNKGAANNNTNNHGGSNGNKNDDNYDREAQKSNLLQRVRAIAFTDSNHNINWTKRHARLSQILTGQPSLYIKSHKVHERAKQLGDVHHDCQFWRHRFGDIKTLWAGTHEHALTNYTARAHIWEHFDSFLHRAAENTSRNRNG